MHQYVLWFECASEFYCFFSKFVVLFSQFTVFLHFTKLVTCIWFITLHRLLLGVEFLVHHLLILLACFEQLYLGFSPLALSVIYGG